MLSLLFGSPDDQFIPIIFTAESSREGLNKTVTLGKVAVIKRTYHVSLL